MFDKMQVQAEALDSILIELAKNDKRIVALSADMADRIIPKFARVYRDRFFNYGIAEQGMMGTAAGLALSGFIPFVATLCCFLSMKTCEQIRTDIAYTNLNVKIFGMGGGLMYGTLGATHQGLEDISLMRSITNLTVMAPADYVETVHAVYSAVKHKGPVYIRVGRGNVPTIHPQGKIEKFEIGKAIKLHGGNDIALIAAGVMVAKALEAAEELKKSGISASVYSMHTIKSLDEEAILEAASTKYGIVTLEDNVISGGMGEAISAVLSNKKPTHIKIIGIPNIYPIIGSPEQLYDYYQMSPHNIVKSVMEMISN
ncbi:MAG: transketolase family protein [Actinobacteria bacterium]|nr:transketolase family protein [Actinomycetota bacterium]